MARVHGDSARIYVNEFNLSGRANQVTLDPAIIPLADITAFEDVADEFIAGKSGRGWSLDLRSWADYDEFEIDQILDALLAAGPHAIGAYFDGSAAGSHGYEGQANLERRNWMHPRDNAGQLGLNVRQAGGSMMGRAMKTREATVVTATENGTGQNHMSFVSGDRLISVVRVIAVTGAGSISVLMEESANDGGGDPYAANAMTAQVFTAVGKNYQSNVETVAGGPWFRHRVSAFSGFTNVTLRTVAAVVPGG